MKRIDNENERLVERRMKDEDKREWEWKIRGMSRREKWIGLRGERNYIWNFKQDS